MKESPHFSQSEKRYVHYMLGFMMDRTKTQEEIHTELPQLIRAYAKFRERDHEEWEFPAHPGNIELRYNELIGNYSERYLARLMSGTATTEDIEHIDAAIKTVEQGEMQFPVSVEILRMKLKKLQLQE